MFYIYHDSEFVDSVPSLAQAAEIKEQIADPGKVKIIFSK
jgi:hypothetical protein